MEPGGRERSFELGGSLSLGRGEDCDLVLPFQSISRLHCVITLVGDRPCLIDQSSTNGTFLNGERVAHAWLSDGDEVRLGVARVRVVGGPRARVGATPPPAPALRRAAPTPPWPPRPELDDRADRPAHLELVYRLGALLSESVDEAGAAQAVADLALEALPVDRVFVLALEPGAASAEPRTLVVSERAGAKPVPGGPSRTVTDLALSLGRAVHSFDVTSEQALAKSRSIARAMARTVLCAPLRLAGETVGLLYADAPEAARAPELEGAVELFQGIADQASLALGRARLHAALVARNAELETQRDRLDQAARELDSRVREKTVLAQAQADELEARLGELERLQAAREATARGLVHDIRNLVGAITSNVGFLRSFVEQDAEAAAAADDALDAARDVTALAEDVLASARIEAGALRLQLQAAPLDQAFATTARRHRGRARDLGAALEVHPVRPGLVVTADLKLLGRLLDNLVVNALKHAGARGRVGLSARPAPRGLELTVSDSGPGVPEEARQRVFEEWYTAGPGASPGHGVGLRLCRLIVEAHGGSIRFEGAPGENRVVVALPARARDLDDDEREDTLSMRITSVEQVEP